MRLAINPPTPWPNWQAPVSTRDLADHHGARGGGWLVVHRSARSGFVSSVPAGVYETRPLAEWLNPRKTHGRAGKYGPHLQTQKTWGFGWKTELEFQRSEHSAAYRPQGPPRRPGGAAVNTWRSALRAGERPTGSLVTPDYSQAALCYMPP